jgi:hypothetical protein
MAPSLMAYRPTEYAHDLANLSPDGLLVIRTGHLAL